MSRPPSPPAGPDRPDPDLPGPGPAPDRGPDPAPDPASDPVPDPAGDPDVDPVGDPAGDPAGDGTLRLEELEEAGEPAIPPTDPPVETALDDDEGGADPMDPDTGRPYDERDPGTAGPPAGPLGGTPEV
jgi:hypothetical protein